MEDLKDTLLRVLRREAIQAARQEVSAQRDALDTLVNMGKLTVEEGSNLQTVSASNHQVCHMWEPPCFCPNASTVW